MSRFSMIFLAVAFIASIACVFSAPVAPALQKRSSGRGTWFEVGLGACGQTSVNSQKLVALSSDIYDGGSHCGETVTITANGQTTSAVVLDECPGCGAGDLDMSPSLFEEFAGLGVGVLSITWNFD